MRGSPPLHLALFFIGFALMAVPLVRLTSATPVPVKSEPATVQATATEKVPVLLRLRFAHTPLNVRVALGEQVLLDGAVTESPHEFSTDLILPKDGIELALSANWPEGTPDTALTLELEPDGLDTRSETRWSSGASMEEYIPFVWKR